MPREPILWREAWAAREIEPAYVKYKKGLGLGDTKCADLPEGYSPLIKAGRSAFAPNGEKLMAHGGISVEEAIVPFVRVRRKGTRT